MTKGIVYVVTGEFYTREAELSAESMKKVMPGINITIFSTDTVFRKDLFDTIINIPKNFDDIVVKIDKIKYIYQSPYDYTVFIDSDTIVIRDFSQVFQLLDNFDMAIAHAPIRQNAVNPDSSIPESFPEMNTGVMVFKKNSAVENLFKSWQKFYNDDLTDSKQKNKIDQPLDQPSFRKALYKSYMFLLLNIIAGLSDRVTPAGQYIFCMADIRI